MYNPIVKASKKGLSASCLTGISSAIIGWNIDDSYDRKNLMGFSIKRSTINPRDGDVVQTKWLNGQKRFKSVIDDNGIDVSSAQAPFQRFRWNDYTLDPSLDYKYEVFPMYGKPGELVKADSVQLNISPTNNKARDYSIYTNRGVTAAQAYLRRFGNQKPSDGNPEILNWLSRGLKESLLDFIKKAKKGESLYLAIYEFHDKDVAKALKMAKSKGVEVKIVFHAVKKSSKIVKENLHILEEFGLMSSAIAREFVNISHNKFIVRAKKGRAQEVWAGTSNFTLNGFYHQTNAAVFCIIMTSLRDILIISIF